MNILNAKQQQGRRDFLLQTVHTKYIREILKQQSNVCVYSKFRRSSFYIVVTKWNKMNVHWWCTQPVCNRQYMFCMQQTVFYLFRLFVLFSPAPSLFPSFFPTLQTPFLFTFTCLGIKHSSFSGKCLNGRIISMND